MENYGIAGIRNVALLSHSGAGKTTLAEAALFSAGAVSRMGRVDDGTTASDFDPEGVKRKISISLSLLPFIWRKTKINFLDAPGYADFAGEAKAAIKVAESAIIVVAASSGVEVGTETAWALAEEAKLPRCLVVNKMDRENVNFDNVVAALQAKFGHKCLPMTIPIGSFKDFKGVIDVLNLKAFTGAHPAAEGEVPAQLTQTAKDARERLIEAVAEQDDNLIEKFLGGEELSAEEIHSGLKKAIAAGEIVPILAGAALTNTGVDSLLDFVVEFMPSPQGRKVELNDGNSLTADESSPLAALVFKTTADPFVGKLTFFRVYRGMLQSNTHVWNSTRKADERIGQLYVMRGKHQEPATQIGAGDIGAVAKCAVTATNDTLATQDSPVIVTPISFPKPTYSVAVHPKSKADIDKLGQAIAKLIEEDPTLESHRDPDTSETILAGLGDTQLDVAAEKMARKYSVAVELKAPRVPYKETITGSARAEYRHKKQTGGHGQFGHVVLDVEALPPGSGVEFVDKVVGGAVPRNYIPAVEKGIKEAVQEGGSLGFPIVDLRATLCDGSFHPVDSSEICFKIAGAGALKKGMEQAGPVLLEPIVSLQINVPSSIVGDIIGDLNTKRAHVQGMNPDGDRTIIEAMAPLAEVQRYAVNLKSLTQGRGSFTMKFDHYQQVPANLTQKLVADRAAELAAAQSTH
ncbi:elongation factor G [Dehalogenimonas alkenigignens]|uniref:Elongation factor G n=1 Tax=Dehalogenimonas alkenigignens TaxID=1217799 RepID=A0A0W0GJX1_9CHLR|nr:elongation factor G [Dehalogenimonas alkenigignens]KTB48847.1 translation elongation factor EF-G [Dehalogenimonas alkenigignens]PVV84746.1 elongation factor G [Dehalogenimonas alkenigignens]